MQVLIVGCNGSMGQVVVDELKNISDIDVICGIDRTPNKIIQDFNVYSKFSDINEKIDVIIDFSHPFYLDDMLDYSRNNRIPIVIATTGYSDVEMEKIYKLSNKSAVFYSANTALGVNVFMSLIVAAAEKLGSKFDIDIIEKHHATKEDSPSGTTKSILNNLESKLNKKYKYVYGRNGVNNSRKENEIGIYSIRAGNHDSNHSISFIGDNESIDIESNVSSLSAFAKGAIQAAIYIENADAGYYDMSDILKNL